MGQGMTVIIYPVKDLAKAKSLYSAILGIDPYLDRPYYVGFRTGDQEIGLDPNGHGKGMTGPIAYCQVRDIRASLKSLVDGGAQVQQEISDVGGGKLIAVIRDADGNPTGLMQSP